jgi:hypothetical protein
MAEPEWADDVVEVQADRRHAVPRSAEILADSPSKRPDHPIRVGSKELNRTRAPTSRRARPSREAFRCRPGKARC